MIDGKDMTTRKRKLTRKFINKTNTKYWYNSINCINPVVARIMSVTQFTYRPLVVLFPGRTRLEPVAIVIVSVVMSLASVQMIRESVERIIYYAQNESSGPIFEIPTIVICALTVGK